MRRRTVRWAVIGVMVLTALRAQAALAAETPDPYRFSPDARSVSGATGTTSAERLDPGTTYRSSLPASGKTYYPSNPAPRPTRTSPSPPSRARAPSSPRPTASG